MTLGTAIQSGRTFFYDANGTPLVNGSVHFYYPGTLNPKRTWQDPALTTLNTNPVILDQLGSAEIYGSGEYYLVVNGVGGLQKWTANSNVNVNIDIGFNGFIDTPLPTLPTLPITGLSLTLPAGRAIVNNIAVLFQAYPITVADNSLTDFWLNNDGTYTIETQPLTNYPALPHFPNKLRVWQVSTLNGDINAVYLISNTYPTVSRPNDIAGTIDSFAETFYLYPTTTAWSAALSVTYGELLLTAAGNVYQVFFPGTTGSTAPSTDAPGQIMDGTAILFYYCQSSYLGMFRYAPNNGTEYYFTNIGLEQVCHKTLLTGSPLGEPAGTSMASMVKTYIKGAFKHLIGNRIDSGTYAFGMKMIAGGYIWLNTTVAGGTAAGSSPFSGSYTPGTSAVTDGTITWLCIYTSYASQTWLWMDVDRTYLNYRSPDSTDSYASTFASLLSRYIQLTADVSWMTGASLQPSGSATYYTFQDLFDNIINQNLDTQISNFLTQTFQNNINPLDGSSFTIQYLEDNCESVKGYREAAYVYGALGDSARQTAALANVTYIGNGVALLYNTTYNFFATNYGQDVSTWATNAQIGWYPYLQAQFFPELCNVGTISDDQFKLVRYNTSLKWPDYFDSKAIDTFPNNFLGFLAAKSWQDTAKAYAFVEKTERYYISGGSVAEGHITPASATTITEWGYYLATKDALVPPLTILNSTGASLNLLNQTGDVVAFTWIAGFGTVTLNGVTPVAVADGAFNTGSNVIFTYQSGSTPGAYPTIQANTPGTGFTVNGSIGDNSTYNYLIIQG